MGMLQLLALTASLTLAVAELYASTAQLAQLLATETQVVSILKEYIEHTELQVNRIRRYVDEFKHVNPNDGVTQVETIVSNPLHAYKLLKILTIDWPKLEKLNQSVTWQDVFHKINKQRQYRSLPIEELKGAAYSIIRLQETYELDASELVKGNIMDIRSSVNLTAWDCLLLGKHAYNKIYLDLAIEWYDEALRVAEVERNTTASMDEIKPYLNRAIQRHDTFLSRGVLTHTFQQPINGRTPIEMKKVLRSYLKSDYNIGPNITYTEEDTNFLALCRGEKLMSPETEKDLFCYLSTQNDPYFLLHPIKVEEHSLDPTIYTFHDVLKDNEIKQIKQISTPKLKRAEVLAGTMKHVSADRTSHNLWLENNVTNPEANFSLEKITHRVSWITGLNVVEEFDSEILQVANYGIGGHYVLHHDYLFKDKTPEELEEMFQGRLTIGDRIATFMFYLGDVTKGGATAFPKLGTAISPEKGAAVFWFNLRKNGDVDPMTLHGGCPVLHGSKWVANKWIREMNQVFTRPCGLTQEE